MHHDPSHRLLSEGKDLGEGDLSLLLVSDVAEGLPVFAGLAEETQVVSLSVPTHEHRGRLAVCRFAAAGDQKLLIVLGYVAATPQTLVQLLTAVTTSVGTSGNEGLRFACGRSELRMDPDGRISLVGDEVMLRARRAMRVRGATIDLN